MLSSKNLDKKYITTSVTALILVAALFTLAACGKKEAQPNPAANPNPNTNPVATSDTDFSTLSPNETGEPKALPTKEQRSRLNDLNLRFEILMQITSGEGPKANSSEKENEIRQRILAILNDNCESNYPAVNKQNMRQLPKGQFKFGGKYCPIEINFTSKPIEQTAQKFHVKTNASIQIRDPELQHILGFRKANSSLEAFETTPDNENDDKNNMHYIKNEIRTLSGQKYTSEFYTRAEELSAADHKKSKLNTYHKQKLGRIEINLQAAFAIGGKESGDYKMKYYANGNEITQEQFGILKTSTDQKTDQK